MKYWKQIIFPMEEMLKLKGIEDLVEKYYNEGYFKQFR